MKSTPTTAFWGSLVLTLWVGLWCSPMHAQDSSEQVANIRALDDQAWAMVSINPNKAREIAEEGLKLAREVNDKAREASLCNTLGNVFLHKKDFEQSKEYMEQGLRLRKELSLNREAGNSLNNLGKLHLNFAHYQEAQAYFQRAIYTYKALDAASELASSQLSLGSAYYRNGQWEKAYAQAQLALDFYSIHELKNKIGNAENLIGLIALKTGEYQRAIEHFKLAIGFFQEAGERVWEAHATSHLAVAYQYGMQPIKAARNHQKAAKLLPLQNGTSSPEETFLSINSGTHLHRVGQLEAAAKAYHNALENAELNQQNQLAAITCHNLALLYNDLGRPEEATRFRFRLKSLMESINNQELTAANYLSLGNYFIDLQEWDEALEYFQRSRKYARKANLTEARKNACSGLYECHKHLGNTEKALVFHEELLALQHELLQQSMLDQNTFHKTIHEQDQELLLKSRLKGAERKLLIVHNENSHLRASNEDLSNEKASLTAENSSLETDLSLLSQDMYMMVIYGLAATLVCVVLLMRYFYKRREYIRLSVQKNQIDAKNDRISKLLQELNHRVKNNLQFISSLLNQQARQLSDLQARQAIRDGLKRVDAIAQLHKKLYEGQDFQVIEMANYISDLCTELDRSYRAPGQSITIGLSLQEMPLEVDLAVSVGLIVNELLTNAYKHAFTQERIGNLSVSLRDLHEGIAELTVSDNGDGLPKDFKLKAGSFGFQLVQDLVEEIDGKLEWDSHDGASFRILFYKDQNEVPDFSSVPPHTYTPLKKAS